MTGDDTIGSAPTAAAGPTPTPTPAPGDEQAASADAVERSPSRQRLHDRVKRRMFADEPSSARDYQPGDLLAARYRVQGLLGRGGMGEVYRARDLVLDQDVAMKFLPLSLSDDPRYLSRFIGEVRLARRVTHPGVCRVHDMGEVDGRRYLSMEYIDGEDLASVLRRIGRLPSERAVQLAHELCAALAALHDEGIVHRDLKPANVMLDGRGRVRIADFGLAAVAEELRAEELRDGTPAYQAPEQAQGREVTPRSDVYALGLILYELFTGEHPWRTAPGGGRADSRLTPISQMVTGIDPAIERIIERCLEDDPDLRPSSVRAVSAALPGGDPIAAALAAGELPSPETVANAGPAGRLSARIATASVVFTVLGLLVLAWLAARMTLLGLAPAPEPFDVLVHEAREAIAMAGWSEPAGDEASELEYDHGFVDWWRAQAYAGSEPPRLEDAGAHVVRLAHRRSPDPLVPYGSDVTMQDPPLKQPHEGLVIVDARGRLILLRAIPPERRDPSPSVAAPAFDPAPLLAAAGLELAAMAPAEPSVVPRTWADERLAWTGTWPGAPPVEVRAEIAVAQGRAVYFEVLFPWSARWPDKALEEEDAAGGVAPAAINGLLVLLVLVGGTVLAIRTIRRREADLRGAWVVTGWVVAVSATTQLLSLHVTGDATDLSRVSVLVRDLAAVGVLGWMCYVVIEPYARRYWPTALTSWTRLLRGRTRDPLVARDVLLGVAIGVMFALLQRLGAFLVSPPGAVAIGVPSLGALQGGAAALAPLPWAAFFGLFIVLQTYVILIVLRAIFRNDWAVLAIFAGARVIVIGLSATHPVAAALHALLEGTLVFFIAIRGGLLVMMVMQGVALLLSTYPITLQTERWYAPTGLLAVTALAVLAIWALRNASGPRAAVAGPNAPPPRRR